METKKQNKKIMTILWLCTGLILIVIALFGIARLYGNVNSIAPIIANTTKNYTTAMNATPTLATLKQAISSGMEFQLLIDDLIIVLILILALVALLLFGLRLLPSIKDILALRD